MKSIVYVMHIDWRWIKQRPQFMAEELANYYNMYVLYPFRYRLSVLQKTKYDSKIKYYPIFLLPTGNRFKVIRAINDKLKNRIISHFIRKVKPDYIYLGSPEFDFPEIYDLKSLIIYDCMDNYSELMEVEKKEQIILKEQRIIEQAKYVFATSEYLIKEVINKRVSSKSSVYLVRNGFEMNPKECLQKRDEAKSFFHVGYFGTISRWFDFDLLMYCVSKIPNIVFDLYGPIEGCLPSDINTERIVFHGIVEHDRLFEEVSDMDVFIMPFVLNDIVRAVDPVKLYEYLDFEKNILCIKYEELNRYEPFVYFYSTFDECCEILINLLNNNELKYTYEMKTQFLLDSTWQKRAKQVVKILEGEKDESIECIWN